MSEPEEQPLSPFSRLFHSSDFNVTLLITLGCRTKCVVPAIIEGLKHTLIKHPRFSSKMEMDGGKRGNPIWARTKVRVEDHVFVPDIDPDMEGPDQFLEDYISNLTTLPMDMSRPLWELHLLQVKTSDAESVGVFKIHHSLGDGMSLMSLFLACCRKTSNPQALPTVPVTNKLVGPSGFLGKIWWTVVGFWLLIRLILNTCVDVFMFVVTIFFLKDTKTLIKGKPSVQRHAAKTFVRKIISLDDIKTVKNAMNMTVNDVLLGMTQAGLSRYLNRRYDEETVPGSKKVLEKARIRSTVYMNLRPNTRIEDLADMMAKGSNCRWGNWIGFVLLPFSMKPESDPLEHVRRAKATIDRKKLSFEAMLSFASVDIVMRVFGFKAVETVVRRINGNTTMTFSSVLGPTEEISFCGHPISYIAPSGYGHSHAITLHYQSYVDKMIISMGIDPTVVPDPHNLADDLAESLKAIKSAVLERGLCKV
ncbi:PREDICTED: O-acyltransferase WSD1-like [Tarenaya hassleriana]|uniref:O-acyltransferase WSD1-like n=1 Tax=Tarenaya hassleriana TaxID=28532 RepID=UPI00053C669E|nr:PREDICTED: O-acyltransferase WSD1-like [Tarenaya hassleriana]